MLEIDNTEITKELEEEFGINSNWFYTQKEYEDNIEFIGSEIDMKRKFRCRTKNKKEE